MSSSWLHWLSGFEFFFLTFSRLPSHTCQFSADKAKRAMLYIVLSQQELVPIRGPGIGRVVPGVTDRTPKRKKGENPPLLREHRRQRYTREMNRKLPPSCLVPLHSHFHHSSRSIVSGHGHKAQRGVMQVIPPSFYTAPPSPSFFTVSLVTGHSSTWGSPRMSISTLYLLLSNNKSPNLPFISCLLFFGLYSSSPSFEKNVVT